MKKIIIWTLVLFFLVMTSAKADIGDNIIAYWDFNTNLNDQTGNGHNGVNNSVDRSDGFIDHGVYSADDTEYIQIADHNDLDGWAEMTICLWFYSTQTETDDQQFITKDDDPNQRSYNFGLANPNDELMILTWNDAQAGDTVKTTSSPVRQGGWEHACMVFDNGDYEIWYNATNQTLTGGGNVNQIASKSGDIQIMRRQYSGYPDGFYGYIDEIVIYNESKSQTDIEEIFNSGAGCDYSCLTAGASGNTTDIDFSITDEWTGYYIQQFAINISWLNGSVTTHATNNGTINLTNVSQGSINVTYWNMTNYFNRVTNASIEVNETTLVSTTTYQAVLCLNATEKITGLQVIADNYTISGVTRASCFNISAGTYNVTANKDSWNAINKTVTIAALSNTTSTIQNMSYNTLTVRARDITTGAYLSNYQINLTSVNYPSWVGEHHASATDPEFDIINGTYSITIDTLGYALTNNTINLSVTGSGTYTFFLYPSNSVNITFFDETTNTVLSGANISMQVILNDATATLGETTNGSIWFDNLDAGSYEIRYSAVNDGYAERSYLFTLTNRSYNNLNLYLLNDTSTEDITHTLYDEYGNKLEGYIIKLLRYYPSENGYLIVDEGATNSEGETVLTAIRNGPYYKWRITDSDGNVLKTTSGTQIYDTSITLYVTLGQGIGNALNNLNGVSHDLNFLSASDQFRFTWDNPSATVLNAELIIYTFDVANGEVYYNSSSLSSSSGTMYVSVAPNNGTLYRAKAYVTFSGDDAATLLDILSYEYSDIVSRFGKYGLFLTALIVLVFAGIGIGLGMNRGTPAGVVILVPIAILLTRVAKLHTLSWTWVISILVIAGIILYLVRDSLQ